MNTEIENLEQSPLGQKQIEDEIKKVDTLYKASKKAKRKTDEVDLEESSLPAEIEHNERAHFTPW